MMVILVRHAERQQSGSDPGLNAAGKRRAVLLSTMLAGAGVTAIFTSSAKRTKETAAPLAAKTDTANCRKPGRAGVEQRGPAHPQIAAFR